MSKLSKELSLIDIYLLSIGYIIGAGIFVIIGKVGKYSKSLTWMPFIIAGLFALIIATTYVDISTLYETNHGDFKFIRQTIGEIPAIITIIVLIGIGVFTNSTVAISIGEFLSPLLSISPIAIGSFLIIVYSIINCNGIKQTTQYNHICTIAEILALIVVCVYGYFIYSPSKKPSVNYDISIPDMAYASILALFVYSGFEGTVKLSEEAKNTNDIPIAIVASVISAIVLYVLVSITVLKCCSSEKLEKYPIPVVKIADMLFGKQISYLFYIIAIISITNTLLISILGTSRLFYSISREYSALNIFTQVDKERKTPVLATVAIAILSILFLFLNDVEILASITSYLLFVIFIILNYCLIHAYQDEKVREKLKGGWTHPINQGKPILPVIGLSISIIMLVFSIFHKY